jgi:hypothetical protein
MQNVQGLHAMSHNFENKPHPACLKIGPNSLSLYQESFVLRIHGIEIRTKKYLIYSQTKNLGLLDHNIFSSEDDANVWGE